MLCHWSQAGQAECWSTYILDIHHACTLPWPIHDYPAYTHILSSQGFTSVHAGLPSSGITIEALASALLRSQADSVISSVLVASSFTPNFGQLKGFCCINSLKLSSNTNSEMVLEEPNFSKLEHTTPSMGTFYSTMSGDQMELCGFLWFHSQHFCHINQQFVSNGMIKGWQGFLGISNNETLVDPVY